MKKFMKIVLCLCGLAMSIGGCGHSAASGSFTDSKGLNPPEKDSTPTEEISAIEPDEVVSPKVRALLDAYPDRILEITGNEVVMKNGKRIIFDDGKEKNHIQRLDESDVEDMFFDRYRRPDPEPDYLFDPGRSRSDELFKAMYGSSASEVQKHLVNVDWFGQSVSFTEINGAADSLRAVAKEIANYPELKPYLKSSGTFYWRPVRGAKRMSAHSYGIAFDIAVDKSDYWLWKSGSNDELKKVKYSNRIPSKLVEIFQNHGFIWGGSWYHFDTMHFEFRPELLRYAELTE